MNRGGSRHWPGVERPCTVTLGYVLLNSSTSSFHSLSSAFLAAGGMQSMVMVTLVLGSSGAAGLAFALFPSPSSPSSLLLVPQAASAVSVRAETRVTAPARRVRRNRALLMGGPLRA